MSIFDRLKEGLSKTRTSILDGLDAAFGDYSAVDDEFFDSVLELLVLSDVGYELSEDIVERMKERVREEHIKDPSEVKKSLIDTISEEIKPEEGSYDFLDGKSVVLAVGVNGTGKTTSIGKLAYLAKCRGKKVILAAADTFRAGASEQLEIWSERSGADFVAGAEGGDPAAVIYEAADRFIYSGADILICDTAGRLHNKKNLMEELGKIDRILSKKLPDIRKEVLIVLDATTGQNAISQVREFKDAAGITGIILTKMDGTAKGGIVIAICSQFDIPVKFIGVGEKIDDLLYFDPNEFLNALFF